MIFISSEVVENPDALDNFQSINGPILVLLAAYAFLLYDSVKYSHKVDWVEAFARAYFFVFLALYMFAFPTEWAAPVVGPLRSAHASLDNDVPPFFVIVAFLVLFHLCHRRLFRSGVGQDSDGFFWMGPDVPAGEPHKDMPGVPRFFRSGKKESGRKGPKVTTHSLGQSTPSLLQEAKRSKKHGKHLKKGMDKKAKAKNISKVKTDKKAGKKQSGEVKEKSISETRTKKDLEKEAKKFSKEAIKQRSKALTRPRAKAKSMPHSPKKLKFFANSVPGREGVSSWCSFSNRSSSSAREEDASSTDTVGWGPAPAAPNRFFRNVIPMELLGVHRSQPLSQQQGQQNSFLGGDRRTRACSSADRRDPTCCGFASDSEQPLVERGRDCVSRLQARFMNCDRDRLINAFCGCLLSASVALMTLFVVN